MVRFLVLFRKWDWLMGSILTPHPLAVHPRLADIAFITQGHQHEQLLINVMAAACAQALQRGDRRVNHHKIRLFAQWGLITAENIDSLLEMAGEAKKTEITGFLLEYQHAHFAKKKKSFDL